MPLDGAINLSDRYLFSMRKEFFVVKRFGYQDFHKVA
jgi:hypothetical protein